MQWSQGMNRYKDVEKTTKMPIEQQNQLLRIFARVYIADKLMIIKQQKKIFFHLKNTYNYNVDNTILTYSAFILSINQYLNDNKNNIKISIFKAAKFRKSFKRDKIIEKWAVVKSLKNHEKLSFRQISQYLQKYHRLDISYSLIYRLWIEIEEKKYKKGEQKNG